MVDRRSIAKGISWAVPAVTISTVVPAFAASLCSPMPTYTLPLTAGTYAHRSATSASGTAVPPTAMSQLAAIPFLISVARAGAGLILNPANLRTVLVGPPEGRVPAIRLQQSGIDGDAISGQQVVLTFAQAVTDLTFTISDIDAYDGWAPNSQGYTYCHFRDRVAVSPTATIIRRDPSVTGAATGNDPLKRDINQNVLDTETLGNATLRIAGPVKTVRIDFWSTVGTTGQAIFLSQISFKGCMRR